MDNEQILKDLFDKSQENNDKMQFSSEEANRFKKAFDDPEFRKLFSEYVDELSDPKNRQETEAYISQLEGEQKVPEGKELIRPEPAFVVKSYKTVKSSGSDKGKEKEKLFLNIVQSLKIDEPSKSSTPKGTCWSVPYSVGPPHMEKDKSGSNSPCFDCCFHPEALRLCSKIKEFKELVIHTAMEGVEQSYKRQGQDIALDRDFHVVKGVAYKDGQVPTMMIAMSSKSNWKPDSESQLDLVGSCPDNAVATSSASLLKSVGSATHAQDCLVPVGGAKTTAPAIKKGFLSSAKTALYGDKLTTIRPKTTGTASTADPLKSTIKLTRDAPEHPTLAVDGDLSLTRASRASTAGELIQDVVQPGTTNGTRTSASSRPRSPKMKVVADTGLKELSSSRKTPPSTSQSVAGSINSSSSVPPSGSVSQEGDMSPSSIVTESTSVSANGLREPKHTFKERGSMSMGDFELSNNNNNSSNVRSNRPSELVYRIELPGIKNASQIVLDVAERQLNLSYPDMYALSIKLPYPVFDRKGTAKFDKGGSALNVTLPVQPRKLHCDPPSSPGNSDSSVVDAVILSDINEAHRPVQAADEATSPNCDRSSSSTQSKHGRWISSDVAPPINAVIDGGVSPGDGVEKVMSLRDEIKLKAELALKEASERSRNEATHRPIRAAEETTIPQDLTEDASTSRERFIPSSTFTGSRKGYVFKRDGEGMGYYLDDVQHLIRGSGGVADSKGCLSAVSGKDSAASIDFPSRLDTTASTISSDDSLLLLPFDFDCRQTKQSIAVLVQVPSIDAASVHIEFAPHQLRVSFRAVGPDGLLPGSLYGMTFDISPQSTCLTGFNPEQCKYDVACQNMAIILVKSIPAYWSVKTSGDDKKEASDDAETMNSVTGESKSSADYELQATKELLRARPYEAKKNNASPGNSNNSSSMSKLADSSSAETASEWNKALPKSLENMIANMQFSSSAVLFDLD